MPPALICCRYSFLQSFLLTSYLDEPVIFVNCSGFAAIFAASSFTSWTDGFTSSKSLLQFSLWELVGFWVKHKSHFKKGLWLCQRAQILQGEYQFSFDGTVCIARILYNLTCTKTEMFSVLLCLFFASEFSKISFRHRRARNKLRRIWNYCIYSNPNVLLKGFPKRFLSVCHF